ncbi:MAG: hypothetical protein FWE02_04820 [Defluviitaleaceae bacterium]|nr:hypothetical protein [Defluviitaleaceae bacterium]
MILLDDFEEKFTKELEVILTEDKRVFRLMGKYIHRVILFLAIDEDTNFKYWGGGDNKIYLFLEDTFKLIILLSDRSVDDDEKIKRLNIRMKNSIKNRIKKFDRNDSAFEKIIPDEITDVIFHTLVTIKSALKVLSMYMSQSPRDKGLNRKRDSIVEVAKSSCLSVFYAAFRANKNAVRYDYAESCLKYYKFIEIIDLRNIKYDRKIWDNINLSENKILEFYGEYLKL